MLRQHRLVAEQPDVAFLGPADDRNRLDQRVLAALPRVAAAAAHHHQRPALEQLSHQPDEESDQRA